MQTAISSRRRRGHTRSSGIARARLRSSVRACFDMPSTMLGQPKNGDARRKSGSSSKLRPLRRPHSNGRRHSFDSIPLPFANALSDCLRTWTGTRPAVRVVSPSRSGVQRSRTARTRGVLSVLCANARRAKRKVPVEHRTPHHPSIEPIKKVVSNLPVSSLQFHFPVNVAHCGR